MRKRSVVAVLVFALAVAACSGRAADGGDNGRTAPTVGNLVAQGLVIYEGSCIACHAEGGVGIEGLGRPLADSDFIRGLSDSELLTFLEVGRETSDPENTSGISMPAKGGNASLTQADLEAVIAYMRSLN